ncbi:MAG: hypothetical protein Q7T97_12795 [Burkholderiaceae bacterium]|nr:hypothetical protein [Burkholderiaceae bacterium]
MTGTEPLGGALWLRPGAARPHNLRSTRPDWVGRVTRGLPVSRLPATLGSLFSLCGHAHIACASMAVDAARGRAEPPSAVARERLALQTLREHLRRIWIDWPRQLAATPVPDTVIDEAARVLAQGPAFASTPADATTWLEVQAIGMPLRAWLDAWEQDPHAWLTTWCRQATGPLPALMRHCRAAASGDLPDVAPLRVHADAGTLRTWAARLQANGAAFARQPSWQGDCAETGVWTRLNEAARPRLNTPWLRLGARLAEVVRLALPAEDESSPTRCGTAWLGMGALPLAAGEAIAWVEMARGLLMHHVQLDGAGESACIAACHVIAPTEWNFHADGAVARVLERLPTPPSAEGRHRLAAVMASYDPCVPYQLDHQTSREAAHA